MMCRWLILPVRHSMVVGVGRVLSDVKAFNKNLDVFFISCGEQDPRNEYTRNIVKKMRDGGVEVRFNSYPGDHEWQVWRKSLHEFAQYLFK